MALIDRELFDRTTLESQLGLPAGSIFKLDRSGRGPQRTQIGRRVFYRRGDVVTWLDNLRAAERSEP